MRFKLLGASGKEESKWLFQYLAVGRLWSEKGTSSENKAKMTDHSDI